MHWTQERPPRRKMTLRRRAMWQRELIRRAARAKLRDMQRRGDGDFRTDGEPAFDVDAVDWSAWR